VPAAYLTENIHIASCVSRSDQAKSCATACMSMTSSERLLLLWIFAF